MFTMYPDEGKAEHISWPLSDKHLGPLSAWFNQTECVRYVVYQLERCPTTGRLHLQGYLQLKEHQHLSFVRKLLRADFRIRRGTHKEARDYCTKEGRILGPWELGEAVGQGKRSDLVAIYDDIKARKTDLEILERDPRSARFERAINFMRFKLDEKKSDRQIQGVRVISIYGPPGTGKTYAAINFVAQGTDYYIAECPSQKGQKLWFDGYGANQTLILDDFNHEFCQLQFLLRVLDKYKLKVEVKGGHVWACWTTVVLTSNSAPSTWYTGGALGASAVCMNQLKRRITEVRYQDRVGAYTLQDWDGRSIGDAMIYSIANSIAAADHLDAAVAAVGDGAPAAADAVLRDDSMMRSRSSTPIIVLSDSE